MTSTRKPMKPLQAGQEVSLANCVETGRVIERLGRNLYRVEWRGQEVTVPRDHLSVCVNGRWVRGL